MKISEIPEFNQERELLTLSPDDTTQKAAEIITEYSIGAMPVMENGALVGVFSERDLIKRVIVKGLDINTTKINEVMTQNPETITPDEDVGKAIDMMVQGKYRHMPVVDGSGNLVGFLSQRDFMAMSWMELIKYKALAEASAA